MTGGIGVPSRSRTLIVTSILRLACWRRGLRSRIRGMPIPPAREDFLAIEAAARQRSLGVWADAGYKPIGTEQADRLKHRTGTFAIVEGRVRSVGERAQWTYLNFGGRWAEDFTVMIPKKTWKRLTQRGSGRCGVQGTASQGPRRFGGLARRVPYR